MTHPFYRPAMTPAEAVEPWADGRPPANSDALELRAKINHLVSQGHLGPAGYTLYHPGVALEVLESVAAEFIRAGWTVTIDDDRGLTIKP